MADLSSYYQRIRRGEQKIEMRKLLTKINFTPSPWRPPASRRAETLDDDQKICGCRSAEGPEYYKHSNAGHDQPKPGGKQGHGTFIPDDVSLPFH